MLHKQVPLGPFSAKLRVNLSPIDSILQIEEFTYSFFNYIPRSWFVTVNHKLTRLEKCGKSSLGPCELSGKHTGHWINLMFHIQDTRQTLKHNKPIHISDKTGGGGLLLRPRDRRFIMGYSQIRVENRPYSIGKPRKVELLVLRATYPAKGERESTSEAMIADSIPPALHNRMGYTFFH